MPDDEMRTIVPVGGSYNGQPISVPAADAKKLIKGGYARDPYQPFAEIPPTPGDVVEVFAAAEKRWRGEDAADKPKPKPEPEPKGAEQKSAEAGEAGTYETRDMEAKRARGRPPGK